MAKKSCGGALENLSTPVGHTGSKYKYNILVSSQKAFSDLPKPRDLRANVVHGVRASIAKHIQQSRHLRLGYVKLGYVKFRWDKLGGNRQ
ncbi:MAG: hypothetical protein EAZ78_21895 [Oscillatoriales cyanobacterium]|uniref:hypothetical protein n=1 Tax=Microcoleus anatoxicus TaxID=2705319 RepID=UPI002972A797|nr:MAG: hypothetical protein EAZ78_21895 [Oscillatoriales cyanobacterium]TAF43146.1 MAG: hypothetical protein EAZ68_08650 [Oscillatoriales cyanobacterium]TAF62722.1 MAG: hypothetical protein EAZ59_23020 [Oscillatoriales cyanobacterium]